MSLDAKYGPALPALQRGPDWWERRHSPHSLTRLEPSTAAPLKYVMDQVTSGWLVGHVLLNEVTIIWIVDNPGDLWFAVEELVSNGAPTGRPKHRVDNAPKLGHPSLVGCEHARIAGEIFFDASGAPPKWTLNNRSGRYGIHETRTPEQLDNVRALFKEVDIMLTRDDIFYTPAPRP
jgi:hypothetical protein